MHLGVIAVFTAIALAGTPAAAQAGTGGTIRSTYVRPAHLYTGSLMVYTAREEFNDGDILYYPNSSYEIRTADGKHLRGVRNHLGNNDEQPEMVELPAGKYLVVADSEREGRVEITVAVRPGASTLVNLQRERPARLPLPFR